MSEDVSSKIKNMALVCAVLVVGIHVKWPHDTAFSLGWFGYHFIKEGIARIAVPFFFTVSGFFLARHFDENGWWRRETGKRIRSLVIPFYIWSILSVSITIPFSIIADIIASRPFGTSVASAFLGIAPILTFDLTKDTVLIPLWYIRCLFLFVLTAAAFKFLVRRFGLVWLVFSFALVLCMDFLLPQGRAYDFLDHGYSLSGVFYFSCGVFLSQRRKCAENAACFCRISASVCACIGILLLVGKVAGAYLLPCVESAFGRLMVPFLLYAAWWFMPCRKRPDILAVSSFPIFLVHGTVFIVLGLASTHLHLNDGPLLNAVVMYVSGVVVPIAVFGCLRKWFPKVSGALFGGRV